MDIFFLGSAFLKNFVNANIANQYWLKSRLNCRAMWFWTLISIVKSVMLFHPFGIWKAKC